MEKIILPNVVAVGVYNAALANRGREITRKRKTTMFELELPIGEGGTSYMDNKSISITEDTVICARPGQLRHTRLPFKCYFIHMIVTEGELYDRLTELPPYIKVKDRAPFEEIFRLLCEHYDTAADRDRLLVQSLVLKLVYLLCEYSERTRFTAHASNKEIIERTVAYIGENLSADLSLGTLAEQASFSPSHFHACFKRSTGQTLREYVERQRFNKAVSLLVNTDKTLADIAYECGFSSQAYFSYAFKKRMNLSPREYVKSVYKSYEK